MANDAGTLKLSIQPHAGTSTFLPLINTGELEFGINTTLDAVASTGMQALVFWPNVDAGSDEVAKGIRLFREAGRDDNFHFFRNLPPEVFVRLMAHCSCMVGNSSAALREGAYLGTPAVSVGSRQQNRECGKNVARTGNDVDEIADAADLGADDDPVVAEAGLLGPVDHAHAATADRRHDPVACHHRADGGVGGHRHLHASTHADRGLPSHPARQPKAPPR